LWLVDEAGKVTQYFNFLAVFEPPFGLRHFCYCHSELELHQCIVGELQTLQGTPLFREWLAKDKNGQTHRMARRTNEHHHRQVFKEHVSSKIMMKCKHISSQSQLQWVIFEFGGSRVSPRPVKQKDPCDARHKNP
jgi:hypothetical protein